LNCLLVANQSVVFQFWKKELKHDGSIDEYKARLGSKIHALNHVKSLFINNIDKKYLCEVEVILGIKITRLEKRIFWSNISMLRRSSGK